ncbi:MAG: undecaprenyl-diphosphate phosphatase [Nitriliruptor sp.]|nr:MAG: undecaprenyl-diphosphate phosphatase [Nitriliruptor sp.]
MTLLIALVLGVIQGVFMFVPVSSTSHLVLAQTALRDRGVGLPAPDSPELILFDLVVHVGTLVSVVLVMGDGLRELGRGVREDRLAGRLRPGGAFSEAVASRLVLLMLLSVAVTGVLGLAFQGLLTRVFGSPALVAGALVLTGAMLWWTDAMTPERSGRRLRFGWRGPAQVTVTVAVLVGAAQAVALAPGISRSGTTIFAALLLGMQRTMAARYSFYVAIPTIVAATGVQTLQVAVGDGFGTISWGAMAVGFVAAAGVGTGALWLVLRLLESARFRVFSLYVWALAVVVLVSGVGVGHAG